MAKYVREIMNRELFTLVPTDSAEDALGYILALGVSGAPVVGSSGEPLGVVTARDLASKSTPCKVQDCMSTPVVQVREDSSIEAAGKTMAERGVHRLIVVDSEGTAIGIVSSLDMVRGLLGLPTPHPATFPHYDTHTGCSWTDDTPLDLEHVEEAPDGPGVFTLTRGGAGVEDRVVWVEGANNVRTRLYDLLSLPQDSRPLRRVLENRDTLRFRATALADEQTRHRLIELAGSRGVNWQAER